MSFPNVIDLTSDDELDAEATKPELGSTQHKDKIRLSGSRKKSKSMYQHLPEEYEGSNLSSTGQSGSGVSRQVFSPVDSSISSTSPENQQLLCRQFWKAGKYNDALCSKVPVKNASNRLHVHPIFLHSNATSHKWIFGAIAELLDNAYDEIQKGATFVIVDKTLNPKDGSPALLIQDDGGGMDPEAIRRCMSFGFSEKDSESAIGQYGNGFKTSSMRLGADAIVFSCNSDNRRLTQSIGLLSYTFLTRSGHNRIVVPSVSYESDTSTGKLEALQNGESFALNLSTILKWSPYSTETELLKQFDDIGTHGTKVIIFNLWFNNEGKLELDFDTDREDIRSSQDIREIQNIAGRTPVNEKHIANRVHYSLRAYLSILYLKRPPSFRIILRGNDVEHHNVADDLKFYDFIHYKPYRRSTGSIKGAETVVTIGFLKEAPEVNIHGFCVYHKNRLILPYWRVLAYANSRGRGVVGVLQANFIEPVHNKQDFEKTSLLQKLEVRLRDMTWEYWDTNSSLIGYQTKKKPHLAKQVSSASTPCDSKQQKRPGVVDLAPNLESQGLGRKEKESDIRVTPVTLKPQTGTNLETQLTNPKATEPKNQERIVLMQVNKSLKTRELEYEERIDILNHKISELTSKYQAEKCEYDRLVAERSTLEFN